MKSVYRFTLALSVCLLLLVPVSVFAQTTGTVEGAITDQSNAPLPGVTVELTSPNLQGTRTAVTSADGRYRFPAVPPGPYKVTAELAGFGKVEKRATVSLDSTAQVNLSLQLSTTAEITVTGEAPMVDVASTTQGSNYSAKVIEKLPVGRNYADIVFTQPGVQADFGETQGRSLAISIYGSTSSENLFLIDGVNTTNVIKGFQGKDINSEFIQEVEVKTGGYQAEYGRNTGGVVNVITKSGGNEFHGGVFGYYNDTGMRADQDNGKVENFATPNFSQTGDAYFLNNVFEKDVRQEWGADLGATYQGPRQTQISFNLAPNQEYYQGTTYHNFRHSISASFQASPDVALGISVNSGEAIDFNNAQAADFVTISPSASLNLGRRLSGDLDYVYQEFNTKQGDRIFKVHLPQARLLYHFSRRAFVRTVLQYEMLDRVTSEDRELLTQLLFSYRVNAQTVFLAGYSDNYEGEVDLSRTDRAVFVKLSYAWLF